MFIIVFVSEREIYQLLVDKVHNAFIFHIKVVSVSMPKIFYGNSIPLFSAQPAQICQFCSTLCQGSKMLPDPDVKQIFWHFLKVDPSKMHLLRYCKGNMCSP